MRNSIGSPIRRLVWAPAAMFALLVACSAEAQMTNRPNGAVPQMTAESKIAAYCQGAVLRGPSSLFFVSQIFYLNGALTWSDHKLLELKQGVSIVFVEKWSQFMHCPYPGANRVSMECQCTFGRPDTLTILHDRLLLGPAGIVLPDGSYLKIQPQTKEFPVEVIQQALTLLPGVSYSE